MRHKFQSTFKDGNGRVVGTATTADGVAGTISVYLAGTTTVASVYTASSGGTAVNSVTTDTHGYFYFWVDPKDYGTAQLFKIILSHSDFESKTYDNLKIFPDEVSRFIIDSTETDQGATGDGFSVKDLVDSIGSDSGTIVFAHNSNSATTTYTFATNETIPSNIKVVREEGAILHFNTGITLAVESPFKSPTTKAFTWAGTGKILLGNAPIPCVYPEWWGAVSDGSSDFAAQLQAAVNSLDVSNPKCVTVQLLGHNYILNASSINIDQDNWDSLNRLVIQGTGYRSTLITVTNDSLTKIFDSPYTGSPVEHGFLFKDFQVTTTYTYSVGTAWHPATCFYMSNGANYEFSNIYVRGFTKSWHLSENRGNDRNKFYRCFASYCKDGFYLETSSNCTSFELCDGTYCGSNASPTGHAAIFIKNSKAISINTCDFSGGASPFILLEGVQGAHISGCDFETLNAARSITIRGISGADFSSIRNWSTGIIIEGNEFWNAWGVGIYGGTDGVSIRNNAWTNNYPTAGLDPTEGSIYIATADIASIKNIVFDETNSWLHQIEPPYYRENASNFAIKKSVVKSWGSAKPALGTWREGDQVWSINSPLFWTCSTSGTSGTLNTGNTTGTIITGTDANYVILNSLTDIYPAVRITIAGAGAAGADLDCIVGGVNTSSKKVAISPAASTDVTDAAISYTAPTFQTECRNYEETITTSGALSTCGGSKLDSSGGAITATLANGSFVGQIKTIVMTNAAGASTVSVTHHETSDPEIGGFNAVDETWVLLFTGTEWVTLKATCTL
ncbi:right-handed parallel beta-helix repeat-containing protein [candidate division WOR-3 bacterium]|nr:right-handed parallel beta-helix repeat-containing protein [candidate division WOR-3 bacterium]